MMALGPGKTGRWKSSDPDLPISVSRAPNAYPRKASCRCSSQKAHRANVRHRHAPRAFPREWGVKQSIAPRQVDEVATRLIKRPLQPLRVGHEPHQPQNQLARAVLSVRAAKPAHSGACARWAKARRCASNRLEIRSGAQREFWRKIDSLFNGLVIYKAKRQRFERF